MGNKLSQKSESVISILALKEQKQILSEILKKNLKQEVHLRKLTVRISSMYIKCMVFFVISCK